MDNSPLSTLPAELRNTIYEIAVIENQPIGIFDDRGNLVWRTPALLKTCGQIRQEATPIHYGCNAFEMKPANHYGAIADYMLAEWLECIGFECRAHLRDVRIDDDHYETYNVDGRIAECRKVLAEEGVEIDRAAILVQLVAYDTWVSSGAQAQGEAEAGREEASTST